MTPQAASGRYYEGAQTDSRFDVASAARTATGNSATFACEEAQTILAKQVITATSGTTPTLNTKLQTRYNRGGVTGAWQDVDSFPQKTANGSDGRVFAGLGDECQWVWTIAGTTPSFTFSIDADVVR